MPYLTARKCAASRLEQLRVCDYALTTSIDVDESHLEHVVVQVSAHYVALIRLMVARMYGRLNAGSIRELCCFTVHMQAS